MTAWPSSGAHSPSDVVRPWPHVYRYLRRIITLGWVGLMQSRKILSKQRQACRLHARASVNRRCWSLNPEPNSKCMGGVRFGFGLHDLPKQEQHSVCATDYPSNAKIHRHLLAMSTGRVQMKNGLCSKSLEDTWGPASRGAHRCAPKVRHAKHKFQNAVPPGNHSRVRNGDGAPAVPSHPGPQHHTYIHIHDLNT